MRSVRLQDIEPTAIAGTRWKPIRSTLGITAFGINAYVADAGRKLFDEHSETTHEELYLVLSGRGLFAVGNATVDAPAGTLVFLEDPAEVRGARAEEDGTTTIAIGGPRREAYEPAPWEYGFLAYRACRQGNIREARAIVDEGLAREEFPVTRYALACIEAVCGERDLALQHLSRAARADYIREWARSEPLLEPLRADPRFPSAS